MNAALAARVAQVERERNDQVAGARFRARQVAVRRARIDALLYELIAVLAELPLEAGDWSDEFTRKPGATEESAA